MEERGRGIETKEAEEEFSFTSYFVPLTTKKTTIIFIIVGFLVYFNALFNGFVWDDHFQIIDNLPVHTGKYFYYFNHTIGPYYRPLMFIFYTGIYHLFQLNPFFYHFIQVALHIVNAILVFWVFRYFSKKTNVSFFLALAFLIHPINVEPVVYIANLQDILFVFLGLMAMVVMFKNMFGKYSYIFSAGLLFIGLFAKETEVLFILIYCLYFVFFKVKQKVLPIVCALAILFSYFIIRLLSVGPIKPTNFNFVPTNTILAANFIERILTIPKIIYFYIFTFVFPADLTSQYWYVKSITIINFFIPLFLDLSFLILCIATGVILWKVQKHAGKIYWYFFSWFWIGLAFHVQLIPLDKTVSDRWFYFPIIGLLGMILMGLQLVKISKLRIVVTLLCLFYSVFAVRSISRNADWSSDLTLFGRDITSMEDVGDVQYNYATALMENKQYDEAILHYKKAVSIEPNSYEIWDNLGVAYVQKHQYNKAEVCFRRTISLKQTVNLPYEGLALTLVLQKKSQEAENVSQNALKKWPNDVYLWRMYGLAAYQRNDRNRAIKALKKSYVLFADSTNSFFLNRMKANQPIELQDIEQSE